MIKVAICDDETAEAIKIDSFVRVYDDCDIKVYTNSRALARDIEDGADFDLYLLDIVMPKPDGIELARFIRKFDETAVIIYLTSRDDRSLDAFRVHASQYLVKPVCFDALRRALDIALVAINDRNTKIFMLKTKECTEALPFHRIVYCELENRTLCFMTADDKKHRGTTLRVPFEEAASPLMSDSRFIRTHTSYIVNMDFVQSIQAHTLSMRIGGSIPIAQRALSEVRERYLGYIFRGEQAYL